MRNSKIVKIRIWPVLVLGFGALAVVVALSGWLALSRATATYGEISGLNDLEHETEQALARLRSDTSASAILIRDSVLDAGSSLKSNQSEVERLQTAAAADLSRLDGLVPKQQSTKLAGLHRTVDDYWRSLEVLFIEKSGQRSNRSFSFIRNEILPRRQAALKVVEEIEELNSEAFRQRRRDVDSKNSGLAFYVARMVATTLIVALIVASVSIFRIYTLEQVAASQHRKVQAAESELRSLSSQLVRAQEDERRALSRDLHDQVGQVLTALRFSLGNLTLLAGMAGSRETQELELAKRLLSQALRATRDLAMGLRPAMLDDLGLEAALEWHTRQHAKLYEVPVVLEMQGALEQLSDTQRTCVYRIVQEALNNVGKYSQARNISVKISCEAGVFAVEVCDDGVGFELGSETRVGLGLLGMRERVGQLGGDFSIKSSKVSGTAISARFPVVRRAV